MVVNMHDGEALVYLKPALEIMAREGHLKMPPSAQWAHLEGLIALLSPFSCVQEFLEGEKYVTISAVPFLIHAIRTKIDTVVNNADGEFENSVVVSAIAVKVKFQAEWGSGVAGTVVNEHKQRGPRNRHVGLQKGHMIAAALDPRFKKLAGIPSTEHAALWSLVASEAFAFRKRLRLLRRPAVAPSPLASSSSASSALSASTSAPKPASDVWAMFAGMDGDLVVPAPTPLRYVSG